MGCNRSKVRIIQRETVAYRDKEHCTSSGEYREFKREGPHLFEEGTQFTFAQALKERKEIKEAKAKLMDMNMERIQSRFPSWNEDMILDLKGQFQTFDINQDGLIDFEEVCKVFEEMTDSQVSDYKREYFDSIDSDGSGAIDFEEYLSLVDAVLTGKEDINKVRYFFNTGSQNAMKLRQLSIIEQIENGVF